MGESTQLQQCNDMMITIIIPYVYLMPISGNVMQIRDANLIKLQVDGYFHSEAV